jgi:thiamine biosynthesis lipoprotein
MKRMPFLFLILFFIALSCENNADLQKLKFTGQAQGTYYAVTYFDKGGISYQHDIDSLLAAFDKSVSVYLPNSIITRVNNNDSSVITDDIFNENFIKSKEVSKNTNGAFDVTVGPLINAWGFGLEKRSDIDSLMIDSILTFVGYNKVKLTGDQVTKDDPRMVVNFNAIAQGYSADLVGKYLESMGVKSYLVDIGGEVIAKGEKPDGDPWVVGIQVPTKTKEGRIEAEAAVKLINKALATSGSYRTYYEKGGVRYSHTIDPATGYPVKHSLLSVSVLAENGITADAYATAFMVMGVDKAAEFLNLHPELDAYFIYSGKNGEFSTYATEGIKEIVLE